MGFIRGGFHQGQRVLITAVTTVFGAVSTYVASTLWVHGYRALFAGIERSLLASRAAKSATFDPNLVSLLSDGLMPSVLAGVCVAGLTWNIAKWTDDAALEPVFVKGSRILSAADANARTYGRLLQRYVSPDDPLDKKSPAILFDFGRLSGRERDVILYGKDLKLGLEGLRWAEADQYLHACLIGASGSGKTTLLNQILPQLRQNDSMVLILDYGGDSYSRFGRPGDVVLSLYDPKVTVSWDFWHESALDADKIVQALIPDSSSGDSTWTDGARQVLKDCLRNSSTVSELWTLFRASIPDLAAKLAADKESLSGRFIDPAAEKQAAGYLANMLRRLGWLNDLNCHAGSKPFFSLSEWSKSSDPRWVFITIHESDKEIMSPLVTLWMEAAITGILQRNADLKNRHIFTIADELANLQRLPSLSSLLTLGRKFAATFMGLYQFPAQLDAKYGEEAGNINKGFQTRIYNRASDNESAETTSADIGDHVVRIVQESESKGGLGDSASVSYVEKQERVVMPEEIRSLEDMEAFVIFPRHVISKILVPKYPGKSVNPKAESVRPQARSKVAVFPGAPGVTAPAPAAGVAGAPGAAGNASTAPATPAATSGRRGGLASLQAASNASAGAKTP